MQRSKAGKYTMDMSAEFHTAVGAATHNNAVTMLVRSFHEPLLMSLREARTVVPEMGVAGLAEHAALVEAIAVRDLPGAQQIIRAHLSRTAHRLSAGH